MRTLLPLLLVLPLAACAPQAPAQQPLAEQLDDYLTHQVEGGFSGAVLAAVDGEVVLRKGYGLADRAAGLPNTPETVFQIGSVAKPFTATLILALQDAGRLRVTDSLGQHFAGVPEDKRGITLHHLLTHTAGFPDAIGEDEEPIGREAYVRRALATPLERAPGAGYAYSNVGYALLAAVAECVTGQPYADALRERVLRPAGLARTGYRVPAGAPRARGYDGERDLGVPGASGWADDGPYWNLRGNGGLLSTADDLYAFHRALEDGRVLSDEARRLAYTPHTDEGPGSGTHYGYGWALFPAAGGTLVTHNGGDPGFSADVLRWLDDGRVLIVLSNDRRAEAFDVSGPLADLLFGRSPEPLEQRDTRPAARAVAPEALGETARGRRALALVEAANAGTPAAYRAFTEAHLDAAFRRDAEGVVRFFEAVANEMGGAPFTLERAAWTDAHTLELTTTLPDGRGYRLGMGFQPRGEHRIEGLWSDFVDAPAGAAGEPEAAALPDTPAGRALAGLLAVLEAEDAGARRTYAEGAFAPRLAEGRSVEDRLAILDRLAGDLDGTVLAARALGADRVEVVMTGGMTFTFAFAPEPPHGLLGIEAEN